jgi:hypothetical protein
MYILQKSPRPLGLDEPIKHGSPKTPVSRRVCIAQGFRPGPAFVAGGAMLSAIEETLRAEWGPEFKANSTLAKRFAEEATPGIDWFNARLADGRQLGSIPDFVRAMADMGREKFGDVSHRDEAARLGCAK